MSLIGGGESRNWRDIETETNRDRQRHAETQRETCLFPPRFLHEFQSGAGKAAQW